MFWKIITLWALANFENEKRLFLLASANDHKIVGGEDTTIEEYPYQVSLEILGFEHVCGGSLLLPNVVLTAAHCTERFIPSLLTVRAGSTDRSSGGQVSNVISFCDHPNYNVTIHLDYDVSLLHLETPFILSPGIQLVTLQPIGVVVPDNTEATAIGWGQLDTNETSPTILQKVNVVKISDEVCRDQYGVWITDRMVCYGFVEGGKNACHGDSGGPIVVDGKQVGIASYITGEKCSSPNAPAVYTRIENAEIQNHIDKCKSDFQIS